jgi:hypothetical protein
LSNSYDSMCDAQWYVALDLLILKMAAFVLAAALARGWSRGGPFPPPVDVSHKQWIL